MKYSTGLTLTSTKSGKFTITGKEGNKYLIEFLETGYSTSVSVQALNQRTIKDPYIPTVYGVGYLGKGKYRATERSPSGKYILNKPREVWGKMLQRCYDKKRLEKFPTYTECVVCDEWLNFQNFCGWYFKQPTDFDKPHLDKDYLSDAKIYCPENCTIIPSYINTLLLEASGTKDGKLLGASYEKREGRFKAELNPFKTGSRFLGYYDTEEEAHNVYIIAKKLKIISVVEYYRDLYPPSDYVKLSLVLNSLEKIGSSL